LHRKELGIQFFSKQKRDEFKKQRNIEYKESKVYIKDILTVYNRKRFWETVSIKKKITWISIHLDKKRQGFLQNKNKIAKKTQITSIDHLNCV